MKLLEKVRKFMYERYGIDDLYCFLFGICIFLCFLNIFMKNNIIGLLELIVFFYAFFRLFSKNGNARRKENRMYLNMKEKIKRPFEVIIKNRKDKEHIYKKCRKCKTILKFPLPAKRGMKIAKCPKCQNCISFYAFKYQKIEIIKNKKLIKI